MGGTARKAIPAAAIRSLAEPEVYERGRAYRRQGAVSDLVIRGDDLTATVAGSEPEPYRVGIRLGSGTVTAYSCTCPYEWGGACKHVVAARAAFAHSLARADFEAAREVAGTAWERVRSDLLPLLLSARRSRDRAEILLGEGMIDEAVAGIGEATDFFTPDPVIRRVMEAAHARHPDWVIRLAEGRAASIMDRGSAGRYGEAAEWLALAAQAYDAAGRIDDWTTRIEALIDAHRRKYKLRPLLEALRSNA